MMDLTERIIRTCAQVSVGVGPQQCRWGGRVGAQQCEWLAVRDLGVHARKIQELECGASAVAANTSLLGIPSL